MATLVAHARALVVPSPSPSVAGCGGGGGGARRGSVPRARRLGQAPDQAGSLIREVSEAFGSQCMVLSIQAKKIAPDRWEAYTDNGRERTGQDVVQWARRAVELGAGVGIVSREVVRTEVEAGLVTIVTHSWFLAAARIIAGPPMSMFSTQSS